MAKKKATESLYFIIQEDLKSKIRLGELKEGDRIMSESEICEHYNVSRITARRTLNNLANEGYIKRIPGRGSFVNYYALEMHTKKYYSLAEETVHWGMRPRSEYITQTFTLVKDLPEAAQIMEQLRITENDELYYVKRVRLSNDTPVAVDCTYVPTASLTEDERAKFAENQAAHVYSIDAKMRGALNRVSETFTAVALTTEDASCLNVAAGTPALRIDRITYARDSILEYNVRLRLTYRCDYSIAYKGIEPRELSI
ncbi:GntR family transcriptional regulator [[Clostridium] hylemonae]|uniref:Transcriptional regulator, GntR family n=1 Tax=[Clostridium] hylemonae DSM 15053 TaxID=553973 RepID=C0BXQ2_9FIRM|nr:GntR family transcriptional regulator [[Clostridium] hylemonae]EEG75359.1 transcriptional regulator, GntR family [[Clostridium] hylemonae DSM 15053]QEK17072.1 HTH-type transcriptional repressor YvoA [[Clostridium] hylemonae DSM 15053]